MVRSKKDAERLRKVLKYLTMETAHFERIGGFDPDDQLPVNEQEVTEFIRRRTKIWLESWVIPELKAMLPEFNRVVTQKDRDPNGRCAFCGGFKHHGDHSECSKEEGKRLSASADRIPTPTGPDLA